jgi:hypothetical protein
LRAARRQRNSWTGKLGHGLARIFTDLFRVDLCIGGLFATFLSDVMSECDISGFQKSFTMLHRWSV